MQADRQSLINREEQTDTDHHFVLSGEVGRLTQQLALGHSDGAGGLSNQHGVVKPHASQRRGDQVSALWPCKDSQRGVKLQARKKKKRKSDAQAHHTILTAQKDQNCTCPDIHWQLCPKVSGPAVAK